MRGRWRAVFFLIVSLCCPQELRELYEMDFEEDVSADEESDVDYEEDSETENIFDMVQSPEGSDSEDPVQALLPVQETAECMHVCL